MDIISVGAALALAKAIPGSAAERAEAAQAAAEAAAEEAASHDRTVQVIGSTVSIEATSSTRYVCTATSVSELSFTPCQSGVCSVRFKSGTTPTVLSLPSSVKMPDWWTGTEASRAYEISIADGIYGVVTSWAS